MTPREALTAFVIVALAYLVCVGAYQIAEAMLAARGAA